MKNIQDKAKELKTTEKFIASNGWFCRFIKRYRLSHRTPTHTLISFSDKYSEGVKQFRIEIEKERFNIERLKLEEKK